MSASMQANVINLVPLSAITRAGWTTVAISGQPGSWTWLMSRADRNAFELARAAGTITTTQRKVGAESYELLAGRV